MVEDLLKYGAHRWARDEDGSTLLSWAIRHGWLSLVSSSLIGMIVSSST
jgi:hypothetical protein